MTKDPVFRKKEEIVTRKIAGETLLVPISNQLADMQRIFALNPVADYIWEQLDGKKNLGQIRRGLLDSFEVNEERADSDLEAFIGELDRAGVIEEVAQ